MAQLLADHEPDGIPGDEVAAVVHEAIEATDIVGATGSAGDVIVCHPFLAHSINPAGPRNARFISNVTVHGFMPLTTRGEPPPLTPVEMAIAQALAV